MVEGLNCELLASERVSGALVPVAVLITTSPVAAPDGSVVRMNVSVQSSGLAIVAAMVPPAPFENRT
jgi:hypothetical protein